MLMKYKSFILFVIYSTYINGVFSEVANQAPSLQDIENDEGSDRPEPMQNLQNPLTTLFSAWSNLNSIVNNRLVRIIGLSPTCTVGTSQGFCQTREQCASSQGNPVPEVCADTSRICCIPQFTCGSVINSNNAILVNEGFPSTINKIANCQYNIQKMNDNICQIKLEFESMNLAPPNPATSMCDEDTFTVVGTTGVNPPVICGLNNLQHVFVEMGAGSGAAKINIATTTAARERSWRIKVIQIPCNSVDKAPQYCLQYYTENSGTINSFNYKNEDGAHQVGDTSYYVCIKTSEGFCAIKYQSSDFSVTGNNTGEIEPLRGEGNCTSDYISFDHEDKTKVPSSSRHCGTSFEPQTTYSRPFYIKVLTNNNEPSDEDGNNRGFSLKYNQLPC